MARILIACWGSHGDFDPSLGLAHGLRDRGHSVSIATLEYFRPIVTADGFTFHPLRPHADPSDTGLVARIMDGARGPERLLREIVFPAIGPMYEDIESAAHGAELLISHPLTIAVPIYAEKHNVPWASTVLAPTSFFSKYDLPVLPPAPWLKRLEWLGPWFTAGLAQLARATTRAWAAPVAAFRQSLGLPPGGVPIFEGQHSPQLVLALFSSVLGTPQRDWPPNTVVTGHMFQDRVHGTGLSDELQAFLDAGPAPVVFTLGSSAVLAPGEFWNESARAVQQLGVRAVFLVGPGNVERVRATMPPTVLVQERAPHSLLLPRASVVVHQCGVGTLGQSLRSGRPMLAVPFAHDQPDNAYRAARLGMARIVPATRYRAARAARALRALINNPSYASAAERVATLVRAERGVHAACDAIEARFFGATAPQPAARTQTGYSP